MVSRPIALHSTTGLLLSRSILFASTRAPLRICLIYHKQRGNWLLPKGPKDRSERVTANETGYPCALLPLDLVTHAPACSAQTRDEAVDVRGNEERGARLWSRSVGRRMWTRQMVMGAVVVVECS
jgi:hypothetical protein